MWINGAFYGIFTIMQFLEKDTGQLVIRTCRLCSPDNAGNYYVDVTDTWGLQSECIGMRCYPLMSFASPAVFRDHCNFRLSGYYDVDQESGLPRLYNMPDSDLMRAFIALHPLRFVCPNHRHMPTSRSGYR